MNQISIAEPARSAAAPGRLSAGKKTITTLTEHIVEVISDSGGHYVYKLKSKQQLPLEQVKEEIHRTLQNQRLRDLTDKINSSFNAEISDAYFGPAGPGPNMAPPARMPRPRMAPSPTAPAGPAQGGAGTEQKPAPPAQTPPPNPPAAQPPAAKPN